MLFAFSYFANLSRGGKTADQKGPRAVIRNGARRKTIAPMERLLQNRYKLFQDILKIPRLEGTAGPKEGQKWPKTTQNPPSDRPPP